MRTAIFTVLFMVTLPVAAFAQSANPGDVVEVQAASLTFGGTVVSTDASVMRVRLESGVVAIPRSLITSVKVVQAAPVAPVIAPPPAPGTPGLRGPKGAWLDRWGKQLTFGLAAGSGGTHETPIEARSAPRSMGGSLGYEHAFPFVSVGGTLSHDRMSESLVASGGEGCPENAGGACFDFDDGLDHSTATTGAYLYAKPYFMFSRFRVWVRGGGEAVRVSYAYTSKKTTYGNGETTAFGPRYGGGVDVASKGRRFVLSLGVDAGGAHYAEDVNRLFGARWKSDDAGARGTDLRFEGGIAVTIGAGR